MTTPTEVLEQLGLSIGDGPTPEALAALHGAATELEGQAIELKNKEIGVKERKRAVRAQIDAIVAARGLLYGQRPAQPGDVVADLER